tara:strand:- start:14 stop:3007 length:2994 start_codon:yes stop_codon:yes gene_type:complete
MTASIQTVQKPTKARALDNSGNNNHGQIYSGRALEFDGISDRFTNGTAVEGVSKFSDGKEWTFACWLYFDSSMSSDIYYVGVDEGTNPHILLENTGNLLQIRDSSSNYYDFNANVGIETNTWYRQVIVSNGVTATCYLNGVLHGTITDGQTDKNGANGWNTTEMYFNGWGTPYETSGTWYYHMNGKMSDGQVWDVAWTADDAAFDYANPEQLALNRGGTSLTNSNLKIWYPMNDGHRGQQSFILDASNTGLGDDLIGSQANRDFSGNNDWILVNGSGSATMSTVGGQLVFSGSTTSDYPYLHRDYVTDFKAGDSIRYELVLSDVSGGTVKVQLDGGANIATGLTSGTNVFYHNGTSGNALLGETRIMPESSSMSFKIDSLSLKPVNDKNHATTVFKGDELITVDKDKNMDSSNNWDVSSANWSVDGNSLDYDGSGGGSAALDQTYPSFIAGRTYEMKFNTSANDTIITIKDGDGSNTLEAETTYTSGTKTVTFVAPATTDGLMLTAGGSSAAFAIDWINVKELGTASGWTDADQQLHIPQTALQSFNQLAWFDGFDDRVVIADTTNDNDDIFDATYGGTVSAWIFPYDIGESSQGNIISKAAGTGGQNGWVLRLENASGSTCEVGFLRGHDGTDGAWDTDDRVITYGKWTHVAVVYNDDSVSNNPSFYINGELVDSSDVTTPVGNEETDASQSLVIGNQSAATDRTFDGVITEISLWSYGMNQSMINDLYNDGKAINCLAHGLYTAAPSYLTGYWRNNGLATWQDLTEHNNDGTVTCSETMLITAGADGSRDSQGFLMNRQRTTNSLNLTTHTITDGIGNGERVTIPGRIDFGTSDFSISFWAYKFQDWSGQWVLSQFVNNDNRIYIRGHESSPPRLQIYCKQGGNVVLDDTDTASLDADANMENWIHVTCTVDRSDTSAGIQWYINGVATSNGGVESGQTSTSLTFDADVHIGWFAHTTYDDHHFNGEIDDVLIYNRILTAAEAKRNYTAGKRSHK